MKRLLVLCLALSGCSLYWGGDDDDICNGPAIPEGAGLAYHNPSTGQCEYIGGGGGGYCCGDSCTDEGWGYAGDVPVAPPEWGQCYTSCDSLDETSCINTSGCQAAYLDTGLDAFVPSYEFLGCWATAAYSSVTGPGGCAQLTADNCVANETCSLVYTEGYGSAPQKFEQCVDENRNICDRVDIGCPPNSHCEQECSGSNCAPTCVPNTTCASVDCGPGYQCIDECPIDDPYNTCSPTCVPVGTGPGSCTGPVTCDALPPTCPANTTAGIANGCYTGFCIPNAACGGTDPGQCYATVTCGSAPPSCPSGTLPGVVAGCYSGYCIPTYGCELAACETLSTEAACSGRADCTPVYLGSDCTCTMTGGCTCTTQTYERCESTLMPL